ncbi:MAG: hypothetical protein JWQ19_901 [Subtercola sp.]|nr:hypothetical protein [Subtercola sp.]
MDPIAVLHALWNHRIVAAAVVLLTGLAAAYVCFFTPLTYESTSTYALLNPQVPSAIDIEKNPALGTLNSDNPYLRSSDSSLAVQVLITQLTSDSTVQQLTGEGLSTDYVVARGDSAGGQGLLLAITSYGPSAESSIATTAKLGELLTDKLKIIQKVNGADDRYLFTALEIASPDTAREQISSRLRALLVVGIGGFVLLFAAVSISRAIDTARKHKRENREAQTRNDSEVSSPRYRQADRASGATRHAPPLNEQGQMGQALPANPREKALR